MSITESSSPTAPAEAAEPAPRTVYVASEPSWQPEWRNVQFDHALARAAANACRDASATATSSRRVMDQVGGDATDDWSGAARTQFDNTLTDALAEHSALIADLDLAADMLEQASLDAAAEQAARETSRSIWHAQKTSLDQDAARIRRNGDVVIRT